MQIAIQTHYATQLLQQHKSRHITAHEEAKKGWEVAMEQYSKDLSAWALAGGVDKDRPKEPHRPMNYTKEYNALIDKISYHQEALLILTDHEFNQIVKDKFGWSRGFMASNSTYLANASSYFDEEDLEDEF